MEFNKVFCLLQTWICVSSGENKNVQVELKSSGISGSYILIALAIICSSFTTLKGNLNTSNVK